MVESDDRKFRRVIEKAWQDVAFKKQLLTSPAAVLTKEGISVPPGVSVEVIESSSSRRYFVLPPAPPAGLGAAELKAKSDGSDYKALVHLLYNVNCC